MAPLYSLALVAMSLYSLIVQAAPAESHVKRDSPAGLTIPLQQRATPDRTPEDWARWAQASKMALENKYGAPAATQRKRASGTN
jgi:hypothetical protein